jgi:hypothetical protein
MRKHNTARHAQRQHKEQEVDDHMCKDTHHASPKAVVVDVPSVQLHARSKCLNLPACQTVQSEGCGLGTSGAELLYNEHVPLEVAYPEAASASRHSAQHVTVDIFKSEPFMKPAAAACSRIGCLAHFKGLLSKEAHG